MQTKLFLCSLAAVMALVLWSPDSALALDTDRALTAFITGLNANMPPKNNPEAVAALFTEDAIQSHAFGELPGGPQRGRKALADFFAMFDKRRSDWTHIEKSRIVQGNRAVWEGVAQGTDKATGKPLKLPIVFFLEFDETGLVKSDRVYIDVHLAAEQLK